MKKMFQSNKKILAFVLVLMLLIMTIPAAVMADSENSQAAAERNVARNELKVKDKEKDADAADSEGKSERAMQMALRNEWAKDHDMPPGHLNLLIKFASMDEEFDYADFDDEDFEELVDGYFTDGKLDVKKLMLDIKEKRMDELTASGDTTSSEDTEVRTNPKGKVLKPKTADPDDTEEEEADD